AVPVSSATAASIRWAAARRATAAARRPASALASASDRTATTITTASPPRASPCSPCRGGLRGQLLDGGQGAADVDRLVEVHAGDGRHCHEPGPDEGGVAVGRQLVAGRAHLQLEVPAVRG